MKKRKKMKNKFIDLCTIIKFYYGLQEAIKCAKKANEDNFNPWDARFVPDSFSWKAKRGMEIRKHYIKLNKIDEYYKLQNKFTVVKKIIGNLLKLLAYKR
jgi:hypothetical protein